MICNIILNDNKNNIKKINDILDQVQMRKRERCIYSTLSIKMIIHRVEKDILKNIPKSKWENLTFRYIEGAAKFPKKFKFEPMGTMVVCNYYNKNWHIKEIDRIPCDNKKTFEFLVKPKSLCDSIVEKHFENINE